MANETLEERVAALETEVGQLKQRSEPDKPPDAVPWWKKILGTFKDDPAFEEAMQLGREYRESLRPKDGKDV